MKRLLVPVLFASILAACGGGGSGGETPVAAAPATSAPSAPPTVLKGSIQLVAGDPGTAGVFDRKGDDTVLGGLAAIAEDSAGNLFVADSKGIRKITSQRVVTTLAPVSTPGLVVDPAGNIFFTAGTFLKKITPGGVVSTVQGAEPPPQQQQPTTCGCAGFIHPPPPLIDGDKATARFSGLGAIARDKAGNLHVIDQQTLRRISPAGDVVTVAQSPGAMGLAVDAAGNVYLAGNTAIRKVTPNGVMSTFAGKVGVQGTKDGPGTEALFTELRAITIDDAGNLYVTDAGPRVRKISPAAIVSTLSTPPPQMFATDTGIARDAAGNVYVIHFTIIERISPAGVRVPWVGSRGPENQAPVDGTRSGALFAGATDVAADAQGNAYVVDDDAYVRKVTADGKVTTLAGAGSSNEPVDGTGSAARFASIAGIATDAAGSVYVVDAHAVRKVSPTGVVTTIAGALGWGGFGYVDGAAAQARFSGLSGIALDADGNIYVADLINFVVRKITPDGQVSTLAGAPGQRGSADGKGAAARFRVIEKMFVDAAGNVYVNDLETGLRKITPDGTVTTLPGTAIAEGAAIGGRWGAVDAAGNFYAAAGTLVSKLTAAGTRSTIAGTTGVDEIRVGDLPGAVGTPFNLALLPPLPNTIGARLLVATWKALLLVTIPGAP